MSGELIMYYSVSLQKNMAFPEESKLFAGGLRAGLDEKNADMV